MTSSHPLPGTLERFSVDDLPEAERAETAEHVVNCVACRALLANLAAERDTLLQRLPPDRFVDLVAKRRDRHAALLKRRRRHFVFGALTVASAAAAVFLLIPRATPIGSQMIQGRPGYALKGRGLAVHRNRGGEVRVITSSDTIRAGDALRIVVTLSQPERVAAWFVGTTGRVDSLLPSGPITLGAGQQALPGSVEVEAPCGDMQVVVGIGATATAETEDKLRRAVAQGSPPGDDWLPRDVMVLPLRCER